MISGEQHWRQASRDIAQDRADCQDVFPVDNGPLQTLVNVLWIVQEVSNAITHGDFPRVASSAGTPAHPEVAGEGPGSETLCPSTQQDVAAGGFCAPYFLRLPKLLHTGPAALRGLGEPRAAAGGLPVGVFAKQPAIVPDPISCSAKLAVADDQRVNQMAESRFLSSHGMSPPEVRRHVAMAVADVAGSAWRWRIVSALSDTRRHRG